MSTWRISEALKSVRQLEEHISLLTDEELGMCIRLEDNVMRRETILKRLYREARKRARSKFSFK